MRIGSGGGELRQPRDERGAADRAPLGDPSRQWCGRDQGPGRLMRVLVATDAWHPQVNGVVRTLMALAKSARKQSVAIVFLTPEGFPSVPVPTYPTLRCALPDLRGITRR